VGAAGSVAAVARHEAVTVRGRIRQLPSGRYAVCWQATRHAATLQEAEELARLEIPPPARQRSDLVTGELRKFICQLHASGMSTSLIAALLDQAKIPTARKGRWRHSTIRQIVDAEQRADVQDGDGAD
jgi:hypothetical protein